MNQGTKQVPSMKKIGKNFHASGLLATVLFTAKNWTKEFV